jgi:putative membrane protein
VTRPFNKCTLIAALMLIAGCAGSEQPRGTAPPYARGGSTHRPVPGGVAVTPAEYVAQTSSIELFLIGASELALRKSANARTREFAQIEIAAHKGTSAQLSLEGRRLNLLPSATLSPRHQAMLNALEQGTDFDALYRLDELNAHQDAEALHSRYAAGGSSPTLRPVAAVILPIIQRHLRMLKYL